MFPTSFYAIKSRREGPESDKQKIWYKRPPADALFYKPKKISMSSQSGLPKSISSPIAPPPLSAQWGSSEQCDNGRSGSIGASPGRKSFPDGSEKPLPLYPPSKAYTPKYLRSPPLFPARHPSQSIAACLARAAARRSSLTGYHSHARPFTAARFGLHKNRQPRHSRLAEPFGLRSAL